MSRDPARTICYEGVLQPVERDEKTRFLGLGALRLRGMERQKLRATSSSTPRVPMVQTADLRNRSNPALRRPFNAPRSWRVALQ